MRELKIEFSVYLQTTGIPPTFDIGKLLSTTTLQQPVSLISLKTWRIYSISGSTFVVFFFLPHFYAPCHFNSMIIVFQICVKNIYSCEISIDSLSRSMRILIVEMVVICFIK